MRPDIPIPLRPTTPYPITVLDTEVVPGFGRGSAEMGVPTANVAINGDLEKLETGVYFGFVRLLESKEAREVREVSRVDGKSSVKLTYGQGLGKDDFEVLPMVMSLGWNPYFQNKEKACELHVLHTFPTSFYGTKINFNVLGYIRPELDYTTLDALIADINIDIETASKWLKSEGYAKYAGEV